MTSSKPTTANSKPNQKAVILNPNLNNTVDLSKFANETNDDQSHSNSPPPNSDNGKDTVTGGSRLLYLTSNRTFQQKILKQVKDKVTMRTIKSKTWVKRQALRGKKFSQYPDPPKFCGVHKTMWLTVDQNNIKKVNFSPMTCNSWTCPVCSIKKAVKIRHLFRKIILLNDFQYFLTLTLDPKKIPKKYQKDTHAYITKLFNHFLTTIKRKKFKYYSKKKRKYFVLNLKKQEEKLKYIWVIEFQKNGNAHLHILLNQFLPIIVIRLIWTKVGGGIIMRIERVQSPIGISKYLTSYITKGLKQDISGNSHFKHFQRRYTISHSCIKPSKLAIPFLGDISGKQLIKELKSQNLGWMYNILTNPQSWEKVKDIEIVFDKPSPNTNVTNKTKTNSSAKTK